MMTVESNLNIEDDLPIATRRKRRGRSSSASQQDSKVKNQSTFSENYGLHTPPETPHRSKKRVKFSDPVSSSPTGLTSLLSRSSLLTPTKPKPQRHSSRLSLLSDSSTVLSGYLQFKPYRELLDNRTKRVLSRNGLSEVTNAHALEKRLEKKIEHLHKEVRGKDEEIRLKDEEIAFLKDGRNTEGLAGVEPNEVPTFILPEHYGADAEMSDMSHSTTHSSSFPSPLDTTLGTPNKLVDNTRIEPTNTLVGESTPRGDTLEENSMENKVTRDISAQLIFNGGIAKRLLLGMEFFDSIPNIQSRNLLLCAAEKGDDTAVRRLLSRYDIDLNILSKNDKTPLMVAAEKGHEAVVQLLLDQKGINPEVKDCDRRTALWFAAREGRHYVVQQLLEGELIDVNIADERLYSTPLMMAVQNNHKKVVQVLLRNKKVKTNLQYENGDTLLWRAVRHRSTVIVELLLGRQDVDESTTNRNGQSVLWFAASLGYTEMVNLLLHMDNVDLNARCNEQLTPLMAAARSGHAEVVQLLLENVNVKPDIQDHKNWTALPHAALGNHHRVVRLLLENGVSTESVDSTLEMISRMVKESTSQDIVIQLLREYQA